MDDLTMNRFDIGFFCMIFQNDLNGAYSAQRSGGSVICIQSENRIMRIAFRIFIDTKRIDMDLLPGQGRDEPLSVDHHQLEQKGG